MYDHIVRKWWYGRHTVLSTSFLLLPGIVYNGKLCSFLFTPFILFSYLQNVNWSLVLVHINFYISDNIFLNFRICYIHHTYFLPRVKANKFRILLYPSYLLPWVKANKFRICYIHHFLSWVKDNKFRMLCPSYLLPHVKANNFAFQSLCVNSAGKNILLEFCL